MSAALIGESDTCAAASAGASLRPSPTISTRRPCAFSASIAAIFAAGFEAAAPIRDTEARGDRRNGFRAVAGEDDQFEPARTQRRDGLDCVRPQRLAHHQDGRAAGMAERDGRDAGLDRSRGDAAELRVPSRASAPSIIARTPWPGSSMRRQTAHVRAPRARRRRRADGGSTARAARRARAGPARPPRALSTRGSGSVSVPVLSNTTVSISARRSIASPELRITPRAEQRSGGDHLHGGNRERQRARTGDDQHRDRRDDRIVHRGAGREPPDEGQRRGRVHHRRIEARRAVGQPHVARLRA